MKFEIKKGVWKREKQAIIEAGFLKWHWKDGGNGKVEWMETFFGRASVLKATFTKHWLVKLAWRIHKAWNLKYDTTEMTAATNEDCIGWLLENYCLMGKKWNFWQQKI